MSARSKPHVQMRAVPGLRIVLLTVAMAVIAGGAWWYQRRAIEPGGQIARAIVDEIVPRRSSPIEPPPESASMAISPSSPDGMAIDEPVQIEPRSRQPRAHARLTR